MWRSIKHFALIQATFLPSQSQLFYIPFMYEMLDIAAQRKYKNAVLASNGP